MRVTVNGKTCDMDVMGLTRPEVSYERLCREAGINPNKKPSVIYQINGQKRTVVPGGHAVLKEGAIYSVTENRIG